jgi:L-aminopeptidase/D-esterase-like protein
MNALQPNPTLTAVPGIRVGHAQNLEAVTGCTVILCPPQTVGGVDQRGGAPGTRETDLLRPLHLVEHVHAVLLAGGSAYGLAAADGVMRYLEEQGTGYPVGVGVVPIVPAAILFDLNIGAAHIRPDAAMGYAACQAATDAPAAQGSVGAGTGATIGKYRGLDHATKGGVGSASVHLAGGLVVAALFAVNALGDVVDEDGSVLAGVRAAPDSSVFVGSLNVLHEHARIALGSQTVIGVVATNARLDKNATNRLALLAHDGLARAVRPAHTLHDGDTIFALATGAVDADPTLIGAYAAEVSAQAIRNAAHAATSLGGVPAARDLR